MAAPKMRARSKSTKTSAAPKPGGGVAALKAKSTKSATKQKAAGDALTDAELLELVPGGLAHAFVTAKLHDKSLAVAGLGAPKDWDGEMPEVPDDIGTVDHTDLANLLGQFVNAISTAIWHSSKAYVEAGLYEEVAEYLESVALGESEQSNESKRKAEARTSTAVVAAKGLHRLAYSDYVRFRDLARTLELRWKTVSRVGGFVGDEAEADDAGAIKASTRGKSAGASRGRARASIKVKSRK